MAAQEEVTQVLDLGTVSEPKPEAPSAVSNSMGTGAFNSSLNASTEAFGAGFSGVQATGTGYITRDAHAASSFGEKLSSKRLVGVVGVLCLCLAAFIMFMPISISEMLEIFGLGEPEVPVATVPVKPIKKDSGNDPALAQPEPEPAVVDDKPTKEPKSDSVWARVENELGSDLPALGPQLTSDQDAMLREKLSHNFNYQRYLGVIELSALRASGSEELLRSALESKKFWTRMRALIGLADIGADISEDDVKMALGDAHSELRARFFKRFEKGACSVGCFFVARAALPHLDELGRAQVIKVIAREASEVRDLFLVAATYDQSDLVKAEAQEWLARNEVDPSVKDEIKSAMSR